MVSLRDINIKRYNKQNTFWRILSSMPGIFITIVTVLILYRLALKYDTDDKKKQIISQTKGIALVAVGSILVYTFIRYILGFFKVFSFGIFEFGLLFQVIPFIFVRLANITKTDEDNSKTTDYDETIKRMLIFTAISAVIQGVMRIRIINCTVI